MPTHQHLQPSPVAQQQLTECTECAARLTLGAVLPGEILECGECGAELEVRSVTPLVVALAPEVEEDWGE